MQSQIITDTTITENDPKILFKNEKGKQFLVKQTTKSVFPMGHLEETNVLYPC